MEIFDFGKLSDFEFFNFGKLGYYYYSKKGRYNPVVGGGVVVVTLGFCAGLPAGGKSLMKSLIIFPRASSPATNHHKLIKTPQL